MKTCVDWKLVLHIISFQLSSDIALSHAPGDKYHARINTTKGSFWNFCKKHLHNGRLYLNNKKPSLQQIKPYFMKWAVETKTIRTFDNTQTHSHTLFPEIRDVTAWGLRSHSGNMWPSCGGLLKPLGGKLGLLCLCSKSHLQITLAVFSFPAPDGQIEFAASNHKHQQKSHRYLHTCMPAPVPCVTTCYKSRNNIISQHIPSERQKREKQIKTGNNNQSAREFHISSKSEFSVESMVTWMWCNVL